MSTSHSMALPLYPQRLHDDLPASLLAFHPLVGEWFSATLGAPTPCQVAAWAALARDEHVLVAAPTGSGKTLAAFLSALNRLVVAASLGEPAMETQVLYVSPLRALSNDIQRGLEAPLAGISASAEAAGLPPLGIRAGVRTGDTPVAVRAAMRRHPPQILVTTPESLYILLTSASGRDQLQSVHTVIIDEIHALAGSKRGSHLALSLARLEELTTAPLRRIGLSATQRPIEAMAALLVGRARDGTARPCTVVDLGHARPRDLDIELTSQPLAAVMSGEAWTEIFDRLASLIQEHHATLVFVNTRRQAERIAHQLSERLGAEVVAAHHGSLSREQRLAAEAGLKGGTLRAVVATASLELGIDVGHVDLVCQVGATRQISAFLQRSGRAGHAIDGTPKARLFPLSRDDLGECMALLEAIRRGELDHIEIPVAPLDVLAQQMVASIASAAMTADELYGLVCCAEPYHGLARSDFDAVLRMLTAGFNTRRGPRSAWLAQDVLSGELRARRGTRLVAITSGGAIPDTAQWEVRALPEALYIGSLDEDFAIESSVGDVFQLGNTAWRVARVQSGVVWVEDAAGQPPNIPFWFGEAPARTPELSAALWRLRDGVAEVLGRSSGPQCALAMERATAWLMAQSGCPLEAARQLVEYYAGAVAVLGDLPTGSTFIVERFFDESGGMQLVIHSPLGSRVNRAWGLALRKRFCRSFNFELQAAATEDAIVLSLTEVHSFPLESIWQFLDAASVEDTLVQALLDAPMFTTRWRWNAVCALALPRMQGGSRVAPRLQRMRAEDLVAAVFPDQIACLENLSGRREVPDHPLVHQTLRDCLNEAMDIERLRTLLRAMQAGQLVLIERELPEPSPLAAEILTARPYAFLDDAPLEERRTLAVQSRRYLDPRTAHDHAHLDDAAVARVRDEAWPVAHDADELQDALLQSGLLTAAEVNDSGWAEAMQSLAATGRAVRQELTADVAIWIALERWPVVALAYGAGWPQPPQLAAVRVALEIPVDGEAARMALIRDRLGIQGPVTVSGLADTLALPTDAVEMALLALEAAGLVMRGRLTAGATETEWCERRLLARIQRYTLHRLRAAVQPVSPEVFHRFLCRWQGLVRPRTGIAGLVHTLNQLAGFVAPAQSWESVLLPARVQDYQPEWLDQLSRTGRFCWLRAGGESSSARTPVHHMPIVWLPREQRRAWIIPAANASELPADAQSLVATLADSGASFIEDLATDLGWSIERLGPALAEAVARGLVGADGYAGLRVLASSRSKWRSADLAEGGRWHCIARNGAAADDEAGLLVVTRSLLARWGVLFPRLLMREVLAPPWRVLLPVLRRLEARGELRGGRFVQGFAGEQFALPEAVEALRAAVPEPEAPEQPSVAAADPLSLAGILYPGPRLGSSRTAARAVAPSAPIPRCESSGNP